MTDIYELLKSGKSADEIAAEFTAQLNDAQARVREEQIEEVRQAEIAKQAKAQAKRADFADVVHDFFCAIGYHYPELDINEDEITDELCNIMADLVIMAVDAEVAQKKIKKPKITAQVKTTDGKAVKVKEIDPFAAFFKQFGL